MTDVQAQHSEKQIKLADKIAKLLRLAENAGTAAEAETFTNKAQSLLVEHAISEELLALAQGAQLQESIVQEDIDYTGIYRMSLWDIGAAVGRANNCRVLIQKINWKKPPTHRLTVIGFSGDVDRVKLLDASLQIQANIAMRRWYEEYTYSRPSTDNLTAMQKSLKRRTFLTGFAQGVTLKLERAAKEGIHAAEQATGSARGSGELVLVNKKRRVDEWVDTTYGKSLRKVSTSYKQSGWDARKAGVDAGLSSNVGTKGLGQATRGALS